MSSFPAPTSRPHVASMETFEATLAEVLPRWQVPGVL